MMIIHLREPSPSRSSTSASHAIHLLMISVAICATIVPTQAEIININGEFAYGTLTGQFDTAGTGSNTVDLTFVNLQPGDSRLLRTLAVMRPIIWNAAERSEPDVINLWDGWQGRYHGYEYPGNFGEIDGFYEVDTSGNEMTYTRGTEIDWTPLVTGELLSYTEEWEIHVKSGNDLETHWAGMAIFDDGAGGELQLGLHTIGGGGPPFRNSEGSLTSYSFEHLGGDSWRFGWTAVMSPEPSSIALLALTLLAGRRTRTG